MKLLFYPFAFLVFILASCNKSEDPGLFDEWELVSIKTADKTFPSINFTMNKLTIVPNSNTYHKRLSVNGCTGKYEFKENQNIVFSNPRCTEDCCDSEISKLFAEAIRTHQFRYQVSNNQLVLKSGAGDVLRFRRIN